MDLYVKNWKSSAGGICYLEIFKYCAGLEVTILGHASRDPSDRVPESKPSVFWLSFSFPPTSFKLQLQRPCLLNSILAMVETINEMA